MSKPDEELDEADLTRASGGLSTYAAGGSGGQQVANHGAMGAVVKGGTQATPPGDERSDELQ